MGFSREVEAGSDHHPLPPSPGLAQFPRQKCPQTQQFPPALTAVPAEMSAAQCLPLS